MKHFLLVIALIVSGCAASRSKATFLPTDPKLIRVADAVLAEMVYLGPVEGLSCQEGFLYVNPPSFEIALNSAKLHASEIGATHLASVDYLGTGVIAGCGLLPGLRARAIAYRLEIR